MVNWGKNFERDEYNIRTTTPKSRGDLSLAPSTLAPLNISYILR